jgi:hypothetical protein
MIYCHMKSESIQIVAYDKIMMVSTPHFHIFTIFHFIILNNIS